MQRTLQAGAGMSQKQSIGEKTIKSGMEDEDTSSAQLKNEQTSEFGAEAVLADSARCVEKSGQSNTRCAEDREGDEDTSIAQVQKKKKSRSAHGTDVARVSEDRERSQRADSSTAQVDTDVKACNVRCY